MLGCLIHMKLDAYFRFMELTGLKLTAKTGGELISMKIPHTFVKTEEGFYFWPLANSQDIVFIDPASFYKTVTETEDTLKIKLFI